VAEQPDVTVAPFNSGGEVLSTALLWHVAHLFDFYVLPSPAQFDGNFAGLVLTVYDHQDASDRPWMATQDDR
jgi:hypothetical protein